MTLLRDANGPALAYVYFEEEPGRRSAAQVAHARRSSEDGRQHRQAVGAAEQARGAPETTSGLLWPGAGHLVRTGERSYPLS